MKEMEIKQMALDTAEWPQTSHSLRNIPRWTDTGPLERPASEIWGGSPKRYDETSLKLHARMSNLTIVSPESSLALTDVVFDISKMISDPDDEMRPTDYAFTTAILIVVEAGQRMGLAFPKGYAYGDAEKGIRIAWHNREREVTFQVPNDPARRQYIYYEDATDRDIKEPVTAEVLEERLRWLVSSG